MLKEKLLIKSSGVIVILPLLSVTIVVQGIFVLKIILLVDFSQENYENPYKIFLLSIVTICSCLLAFLVLQSNFIRRSFECVCVCFIWVQEYFRSITIRVRDGFWWVDLLEVRKKELHEQQTLIFYNEVHWFWLLFCCRD